LGSGNSVHSIFRSTGYREGRWRNGLGVSWDIAQQGEGENFGWRMALARLDADVPFSNYPGVDRIFTLIEGDGLTLDVEGTGGLQAVKYRPVHFPGDRPAACRLTAGPCRALNLFLRRGAFKADVTVTCHAAGDRLTVPAQALVFVADGLAGIDGATLSREDSCVTGAPATARCLAETILWRAMLLQPKAVP
jgi:uncharacterized protein